MRTLRVRDSMVALPCEADACAFISVSFLRGEPIAGAEITPAVKSKKAIEMRPEYFLMRRD
jgi:hypothetical protein